MAVSMSFFVSIAEIIKEFLRLSEKNYMFPCSTIWYNTHNNVHPIFYGALVAKSGGVVGT